MFNNDIVNELGTNFIEYSVAVNTDRALPDAKSGLKPVAKRILWCAYENGRTYSKPHVKCARIVGDTMGSYHVHGDSSIYGALVRLSQNWVLRYPLIDFHGNNGTIMGDGPAASRYTEARLSKIAEDGMLLGIKKKNVDFGPNYDETLDEPVTLPALFPNLLCNPNIGVGVAVACSWLPHNLKEVAQAIFAYMDGNEPTLPGPDFPTGGIIINANHIPAIMKTGHGSVKLRGRHKIEGQKIIFYELPYGTTVESLLEEIDKACEAKEIVGISKVSDESNKSGIRVVIKCERGADMDKVLNSLFTKTSLQTSISYNQVALIDKTPVELNLTDCCRIYVDHNTECIAREAKFDLAKATKRLHIVEGLLKALEDIDNIISLIKTSQNAASAKVALIEKYNFTETQTEAIMGMKLSSLAKLEKVELNNERQELESKISEYNAIIANPDKRQEVLRKRLTSLVAVYGDDRRTALENIEFVRDKKAAKEEIVEDCVVIAYANGFIKREKKYSPKPAKNLNDSVVAVFQTKTNEVLFGLSANGKSYRIPVKDIQEGKIAPVAAAVEAKDEILLYTDLNNIPSSEIIMATKNGYIKQIKAADCGSTRKIGVSISQVKDDDKIVYIGFANKPYVATGSSSGRVLVMDKDEIPISTKVARGVKSMKLDEGEVVTAASTISLSDPNIVIAENGRVSTSRLSVQKRAGRGAVIHSNSAIRYIGNDDKILIAGTPVKVVKTSDAANQNLGSANIKKVVGLYGG